MLVALGAASLSLWGVGASSPLRQDALDFLHIKAIGAPATLLLMVAQVRPLGLGLCAGILCEARGHSQLLCISRRTLRALFIHCLL